tara:strand:+ start:63 stop:860 length:798 start_codon:yes stop_codon:yes gene_type:complete
MNKDILNPLVDSHCHLDFPEFDDDLPQVIERAKKAGIEKIITICTKLGNLEKVKSIAERHPIVFFSVGSHPLNTDTKDNFNRKQLLVASSNPKMVGIGETGLDYFYSSKNSIEQKKNFRMHITVARECALPLIVHSRAADEDMIRILTEEYKIGKFQCVLHCFSSGEKLARSAIDLGFYLSISGIATFAKSNTLRDILSTIPRNRLLVETDSPYLAPPPFRGKRNEPSYVVNVAKIMANYFNIDENIFRKTTSDNFNQLFKKTNY